MALFFILMICLTSKLNRIKKLIRVFKLDVKKGHYRKALKILNKIQEIYLKLSPQKKREIYPLIRNVLSYANHHNKRIFKSKKFIYTNGKKEGNKRRT